MPGRAKEAAGARDEHERDAFRGPRSRGDGGSGRGEAITVLSKAQRSILKLPRYVIMNPLLRIIDLVIIRNNGLFAASESEAANHERAPPAERRL